MNEKALYCPFCNSDNFIERKDRKKDVPKKKYFCLSCKRYFKNPSVFIPFEDIGESAVDEIDIAEAQQVMAEPATAKRIQELDENARIAFEKWKKENELYNQNQEEK